jgi:hypothetical protein
MTDSPISRALARIDELEADVRHLSESNASYVEGAIRLTTELISSRSRVSKLEAENASLREVASKAFDLYNNAASVDMPVDAHAAMNALGNMLLRCNQ